jgi:hypothetical protein
MKFLAVLTVAIGLFCFAAAVTLSGYSDTFCGTLTPATSNFTNPLVVPLKTCYTRSGVSNSLMYTSCGGGKTVVSLYSDKVCSGASFRSSLTYNTDVCEAVGGMSSRYTCAPASSVNVALAAVAAAAVLLFVQ